ncbi:MAG: hypothetical protein JWM64_1, partial [Frankiales bacterium]|nr:hypothetical protein [Frankiales bacterium]
STSPSGAPASAACVTGPVGLPTPTLRSGSSSAVRLAGTPGATVDVVAYTRPSTTYRTVRSVVLPASGRAEVVLRPPSNTRLYARQRGCSAGPSAVLTVTSTLSLDADRTGPRAYRLAGNSLPKRAGGLPVALYRVQADGSEVLTARTRTDPRTGAWSLSRTFSGTGRYGFVLRSSTDVTNAAGASAVRTVVLR